MNVAPPVSARIFVIAAVSDVLPWSTCPIVPTLQCGFVRSNFAFAMKCLRQNVVARRRSGAGDGNRTHVSSLEGWRSTIELHPPLPPSATPNDLQSRALVEG